MRMRFRVLNATTFRCTLARGCGTYLAPGPELAPWQRTNDWRVDKWHELAWKRWRHGRGKNRPADQVPVVSRVRRLVLPRVRAMRRPRHH